MTNVNNPSNQSRVLKDLFPMRYWVWHVTSTAVWWMQCCLVTSELAQISIRFMLDIHFTWWLFLLSGPDTKINVQFLTFMLLITTHVYCRPHNA